MAACLLFAVLLSVSWLPGRALDPGINATHIVVGQTAPFSGLQADYGTRLAAGIRVAFEEANAAGGVQGRNLTLMPMDDDYEPARALVNFYNMSTTSLLLAGVYGSSIMTALLNPAVSAGIPVVGPYTGVAISRNPFHQEIVNVRASYTDEMVAQATYLIQTLRVHRVACLYQNDSFGQTALQGLTAALRFAGIELVAAGSYTRNTVAVEPALQIIAGAPQRAQAVVLASLEVQNIKFIELFRRDNRTDPNCTFVFMSTGATSWFASKISRQLWNNLYFFQVVPMVDDPTMGIVAHFKTMARRYLPPDIVADPLVLEGYVDGRLVATVLQGINGEVSRRAFLDQLYNTRLFVFEDLSLGLYNRNYSGCERVICASNTGLRTIFMSKLDPVTGAMMYDPALPSFHYSVTEREYPPSFIFRPLLFGQLLPTDDPVWRRVAEAIGAQLKAAFAALNAKGGIAGRPVELVQRWYAGDPAPHAAALADRYALLALVGSVVGRAEAVDAPVTMIGTYETDPPATGPRFNATDLKVQASVPLELMGLVAFALQLGGPVHLRAAATPTGAAALEVLGQSIHTLQQQLTTSRLYNTAGEALQGLTSGTVVAVGSDADVLQWFLALGTLPGLRLLIPSPRAVHLQATVNVSQYPQASRLHYPFMFGPGTVAATPGVDVGDAVAYGTVLGAALAMVLPQANDPMQAYTTPNQVLAAWYRNLLKVNGTTLGPYFAAACTAGVLDCECNQGLREVAVVTIERRAEPLDFFYITATCSIHYLPYVAPAALDVVMVVVAVVVGTVVGSLGLGSVGWYLHRRGHRNNSAAPKKPNVPFCILFTDIQASTRLWATIPDVMATALHAHHTLIRRLIARHRLYEVKTIGDSFMCAAHTPRQALDFAEALQLEFHAYDWGTAAIDIAYEEHHMQGNAWGATPKCWNGLRVRVGIHYGMGDIQLDPVSQGYDYYGTVVNTAARVESVCHGGQIGVTQEVWEAVGGEHPGTVWEDLGVHVLRGLSEPVHLRQVLPVGLQGRRFPPLRLDHAAPAPDEERLSPHLGLDHREPHTPLLAPGVMKVERKPSHSRSVHSTQHQWAETHPLVRNGTIGVEDLLLRHHTVLRALLTLLDTQTRRVREAAVTGFCERLHVRNFGCDGPQLQETLQGLVQRVLPAAIATAGPAATPRSQLLSDRSRPSLSPSEMHPEEV